MSWQQALLHIGNFLLLPIFLGTLIGLLAHFFWYQKLSRILIVLAGISGCLSGLVIGWIITSRDGHMLGYTLCIVLCSFFILITGGKINPSSSRSRKPRKNSKS